MPIFLGGIPLKILLSRGTFYKYESQLLHCPTSIIIFSIERAKLLTFVIPSYACLVNIQINLPFGKRNQRMKMPTARAVRCALKTGYHLFFCSSRSFSTTIQRTYPIQTKEPPTMIANIHNLFSSDSSGGWADQN